MEHATDDPDVAAPTVRLELFSTSFCGACRQTRAVLERAASLVPGASVTEHDLALEPDLGERLGIVQSPTTIVRDASGRELLRAAGVPTVPQVLVAAERALAARPGS
jgi:thiol-disulfide isomerase/thioredoxin